MIPMYDYQMNAISRMNNGSILCGNVGSGKSRTSLAYYFIQQGGQVGENYIPMNDPPQDLYIITTARKRDTKEWEGELCPFLMSTDKEVSLYSNKVVIDSWNNIGKYKDVKNSFFIFDEQRVVGSGAWVKSFLKITSCNNWILLSATPGDTWTDYIPVFIANGFYRNRTEFNREHVIFSRFSKFPQVDRYINTGRLNRLRRKILVEMDYKNKTIPHHESIFCEYDILEYKKINRDRWNYEKEEPIETAAELCYALRKCVNSHISRMEEIHKILENKKKVIIFYNFDYELDILKSELYEAEVAEWNGHKHQPVPKSESWAYLVQYNAGAEGWNCITTDTIIFYSQNYSYKTTVQAAGRIDRLNTPFTDLYFYHIKSHSPIDVAISKALSNKKKFNETKFFNS